MPMLYGRGVADGWITLERFVDLTATTPARQFGLYPRKGHVSGGADADIILFDPSGWTNISAETQYQAMDYTPYDGWKLPGRITQVYSRGELVVDEGRFVGTVRRGEYLHRSGL